MAGTAKSQNPEVIRLNSLGYQPNMLKIAIDWQAALVYALAQYLN